MALPTGGHLPLQLAGAVGNAIQSVEVQINNVGNNLIIHLYFIVIYIYKLIILFYPFHQNAYFYQMKFYV